VKLKQICEWVDAEILYGEMEQEVEKVMASDLMSDVLAYCCSGALLVTGLTNHQTVRTAEVVDLSAIMVTRGKEPSEETIKLARARNIPLMQTRLPMFKVCGILYGNGLSEI
jgi:predicted transcriptional regulator